MEFIILITNILQIILLIYLGITTLYLIVFAISGLFKTKALESINHEQRRIAVLIPGYKEDGVILEVAKMALKQSYPSDKYDVVIIADTFQPSTLQLLKELPLKVIEVQFEVSTKAKALNKAFEILGDAYDIAVILDADNIMEFDFLKKLNGAFVPGTLAIQGHRTAKNMNTSFAILDAISEEINNHIFRKGHINIGLSSAIIGSGVGFDYLYFKNLSKNITAIGGFDKEVELAMLKSRKKIGYLHDAWVYDEKVQKAEVFSNQRRRWLSAQVHYFRKYFLNAIFNLIWKGNIEYFNKAFQFIQLPRVLLLGFLALLTPIFLWFNLFVNQEFCFYVWVITLVTCLLTFAISVPKRLYNYQTYKALQSLPEGMIRMLLSLIKIKGANKKFIHTVHGNQ
jgi:cellulose synthase/poly-beta-1,6-N-acetylglucosamine synthase-like glycosyltransferase